MKSFNLEKAVAGAKLVTRAGKRVTGFHYFKEATFMAYPIRAHIEGETDILSYSIWGTRHSQRIDDDDLVMYVEKKNIPLTYEDLPGAPFWIGEPNTPDDWEAVHSVNKQGVYVLGYFGEAAIHPQLFTWNNLKLNEMYYSTDRKIKHPFYKTVDV